ncbi:MAG: Holliday junction resolvase RuvX [Eubacteriales bacterium]|nr:Holliday junction resolvase RuvX [Eubacteriales bacterium]
MLEKRIMCLDLGEARIGVAVSDLLGITAQGAGFIASEGEEKDIEKIKALIKEKDVGLLLVGYPINMDGTEGNKGAKVREQFERMKEVLPCEVMLWDERLSTKEAQRVLASAGKNWKKIRNSVDETAAQIILQSYLDTKSF